MAHSLMEDILMRSNMWNSTITLALHGGVNNFCVNLQNNFSKTNVHVNWTVIIPHSEFIIYNITTTVEFYTNTTFS